MFKPAGVKGSNKVSSPLLPIPEFSPLHNY